MSFLAYAVGGFLLLVFVIDFLRRRLSLDYLFMAFSVVALGITLLSPEQRIVSSTSLLLPVAVLSSVYLLRSPMRRWLALGLGLWALTLRLNWHGLLVLLALDSLFWTQRGDSRYARLLSVWVGFTLLAGTSLSQGMVWVLMGWSAFCFLKALSSSRRYWNAYALANLLRVLVAAGYAQLSLPGILLGVFFVPVKDDRENERLPMSWIAILSSVALLIGLGAYLMYVWLGDGTAFWGRRLFLWMYALLLCLPLLREVWFDVARSLNEVPLFNIGPRIYCPYINSRTLPVDMFSRETIGELFVKYGLGLGMLWHYLEWYWVRLWFVVGLSGVIWYVSSIR